jgi:hypothetical protein
MNVTSGKYISDFTNSGTGVSWDLTAYLNSSTLDTVNILNTTAGGNSTIKITADIIPATNYEPISDDWGMTTFDVGGNDIAFLSGSHSLGFPHSENDSWSSSSSVFNAQDPIFGTPYPTHVTGSVIATGQVVTNYGTFKALLVEENFSVPGYSINETYYYWETKEYGRIATLIDGKLSVMKNNNFNPISTVSTNQLTIDNVAIYPNPSTENFTIKAEALESVKLFDAIGNLVFSKNVTQNSIIVTTTNLNSGIYFVQCKSNGSNYTSRMVVK